MKLIGFSIEDLKSISVFQALELIKLHNHIKNQELKELEAKQNKPKKQASQKDINMLFS